MRENAEPTSTLPHFKKPIPLTAVFLLALLCPALYFTCLFSTQNDFISIFQIGIFFIPGFAVLKLFQIQNATNRERLARNLVRVALFSLGLTVVLNFLLEAWLKLVPMPKEIEAALQALMHVGSFFGLVRDLVSLALIPAICEEIFFRGFFQTGLGGFMGKNANVIVAALFFALYHLNPWLLPFYFVLGLFFGYTFTHTKNIGFAILAHFINNAFGVIMYHLVGKAM